MIASKRQRIVGFVAFVLSFTVVVLRMVLPSMMVGALLTSITWVRVDVENG